MLILFIKYTLNSLFDAMKNMNNFISL